MPKPRVMWATNDWMIWHAVDTATVTTSQEGKKVVALCGRDVAPDLHRAPGGEWCDQCRRLQIRITTEDSKPLGWMQPKP